MKRFTGLSSTEVADRIKNDQTNDVPDRSSRRVVDILRANIFTRFNALLAGLAVAVMIIDKMPLNALFGLVMIVNSGVGIFQELRAKRTLDRLSILAAPRVTVIRDGRSREIPVKEIVQDDLIKLKLGDQVVADGPILDGEELEIDESLLTGESDPVIKNPDDQMLSGSIVVAGQAVMRAEKIGADAYSSRVAAEAKAFQRASSELIAGTNKLLRWVSWMLIVVAPILIVGQLRVDGSNWRESILYAIAAIVGMIPEGLVLLTSAAFMLAAIYLARRKVLVQQLPAVETLARVDTLLLDKTGTLTEGNIRYEATILEENVSKINVEQVLAAIARRAKSPTNDAISTALSKIIPADFSQEIPFSSARKWSALQIDKQNFIFGAPEVILANQKQKDFLKKVQKIAKSGKRVLILVKVGKWPNITKEAKIAGTFGEMMPLATVVLSEKVRPDAAETLNYFADQNVQIKIISGDSPLTVAAVSRQVGLKSVKAFDARDLPNPEKAPQKFLRIIQENNVFGRVQPEQKRQIAAALQSQKHVVAMTGDGVNDALALKKADLGIAMQSGSSATKAVAEIVLLDNKFSHLPSVLSEGRRVIANIERVANLFIIKNVYSLTLALAVTMFGLAYPYLPIQMSVISALSIGIPAFFLALGPNKQIYRPGFLKRVLRFAVPVGVIAAAAMMTNYYLLDRRGMDLAVAGTSVSIVAMMIVMTVLVLLARPLRGWKLALIATCAVAFVVIILLPGLSESFRYQIDLATMPTTLLIGSIGAALVVLVKKIDNKIDLRS